MFYIVNTSVPSFEQLEYISDNSAFATGGPPQLRMAWEMWNKYTPDIYYNLFASNFKNPLLILNGDFDPQTPLIWADSAAIHFTAKNQGLVIVPFSPHGTVFQSPIANSTATCGMQLMTSFINSFPHQPNTNCINDVAPPDWQGIYPTTQQASMTYFGSNNLWD